MFPPDSPGRGIGLQFRVHPSSAWKSLRIVVTDERFAHLSVVPLWSLESLLGKLVALEKFDHLGRFPFRIIQALRVSKLRSGVSLGRPSQNITSFGGATEPTCHAGYRSSSETALTPFFDASTHGCGDSCDNTTINGV